MDNEPNDDDVGCKTPSSGLLLLKHMMLACSRASEIARVCRQDPDVFNATMINRKTDREFADEIRIDNVTLADVLIQISIIHDIETNIPQLKSFVKGEETGAFESQRDGSSIHLKIHKTEKETAAQLALVLQDEASPIPALLAQILHKPHDTNQFSATINESTITTDFDLNDVGMWIDPIDATSAYINGKAMGSSGKIIDDESGNLPTCTILCGAFNRSTGNPICGVVGQPFSTYINREANTWTSRSFWGIVDHKTKGNSKYGCFPNETVPEGQSFETANAQHGDEQRMLTVVSKSEPDVGFAKTGQVKSVSGCGYKLLCVIRTLASAYAVTMNTTYPWDTCGPHAIVVAMGGSVTNPATSAPITYSVNNADAHPNGVLACQNARAHSALSVPLFQLAQQKQL